MQSMYTHKETGLTNRNNVNIFYKLKQAKVLQIKQTKLKLKTVRPTDTSVDGMDVYVLLYMYTYLYLFAFIVALI